MQTLLVRTSSLNSADSNLSPAPVAQPDPRLAWLRVSVIAAASAFVGGLAAAWFYRKTLTRLRDVDSIPADSNFRTTPEEEI